MKLEIDAYKQPTKKFDLQINSTLTFLFKE